MNIKNKIQSESELKTYSFQEKRQTGNIRADLEKDAICVCKIVSTWDGRKGEIKKKSASISGYTVNFRLKKTKKSNSGNDQFSIVIPDYFLQSSRILTQERLILPNVYEFKEEKLKITIDDVYEFVDPKYPVEFPVFGENNKRRLIFPQTMTIKCDIPLENFSNLKSGKLKILLQLSSKLRSAINSDFDEQFIASILPMFQEEAITKFKKHLLNTFHNGHICCVKQTIEDVKKSINRFFIS
jgi:hypothetical protein